MGVRIPESPPAEPRPSDSFVQGVGITHARARQSRQIDEGRPTAVRCQGRCDQPRQALAPAALTVGVLGAEEGDTSAEWPVRRAAAIGLVGKALEFASLVPLVTVLPRVLGPSDYGLFALGASIVTIAGGAASLGGPTIAARFLAAAPQADRAPLARAVIRRSAAWRIGAASLIAAVVLVTGAGDLPSDGAWLILAAVVLDVVATLLLQAALPLGGVVAWSIRYPLQNVVVTVAAIVLYDRLGAIGVVAALPVASGAALVLGAITAWPRLRGATAASRLPDGMRRFALLQGTSGLMQLVLLRGSVIAVGLAGSSSAQVGFAGLAVGVATALTYALWQPYAVELPRLVTMPLGEARAWLERTTRLMLVILVPILLIGLIVAQSVVPHVLGPSFSGAIVPVGVALAVVPLAPPTAALNQAVALDLRPELRLLASGSGALVFVLAAIAMVPRWDAAGASGALVAGAAVTTVVGAVACSGVIRVRESAAAVAASAAVVVLALVT
jgi:O-antigen/teichoic acid export membrane protein